MMGRLISKQNTTNYKKQDSSIHHCPNVAQEGVEAILFLAQLMVTLLSQFLVLRFWMAQLSDND